MDFVSIAPPCPPLHQGPLVGEYCGPGIPAGGSVTCTWFPGAFGASSSLVVGLDADGDGNVATALAVEELSDPLGPGTWLLGNPFSYGVRVIAYPTNGLAASVSYVTCS